ncbi:MAG: hypothetical protein AB9897_05890 [Anaerolineaceae bacterium]
MSDYRVMTFDEWVEKYKPLLDKDGEPRLFDSSGEDGQFVIQQNPLCVWTDKSYDDWNTIDSGLWRINRNGYYITKIPFKEGQEIQIVLSSPDENDIEAEDKEMEDQDEIKVEGTDVYYRLTDSKKTFLTFLRRNEKRDPNWCNVLDKNGNYIGDNWNWIIIQDFIKAGTAVEVTYEEVMDEIKKRKNSNEA